VLLDVAASEQPAVHDGVQRLHASVEHLGEVRDLRNVADGNAGVAERFRRATRGYDLPLELSQAASEVDEAGFI
jgi:hypothetical protein